MKRLLITGENSYIGESLKQYLTYEKYADFYEVHTQDMRKDSWKTADFSGYDAVFHVAGIAHVDSNPDDTEARKRYFLVNCELALETAAKAKAEGCKQFIYMSSMIVYGDSAPMGKKKMIGPNTQPKPANCYGESKLMAEEGLKKMETPGFKIVILRPPMIYGSGSKGNYPRLSKLARKSLCFPNIENERSMLYIENLCEFVRLMIENNEQGTFYPQNQDYVCTSQMVRQIALVHGKKIWMPKVFNPLIALLGQFTGIIAKIFGNLTYEKSMSVYAKGSYQVKDFSESIRITEGKG